MTVACSEIVTKITWMLINSNVLKKYKIECKELGLFNESKS